MKITEKLLRELQNRLKVGNRRGVHLNGIPARSRYKFDLSRLSHIDSKLPKRFINDLLTKQPLKFKITWKDNVPDLNSLFEEDQVNLVKITKSFENLINQTEAIESEKGINTFGFGFPMLVRRDQADNKLTVAPILIWSLRIKRTKEFNTWVIHRDEDDPIYINEVLINHLQSDSKIEIEQVSSEMMDDGLIDKEELLDICVNLIESINTTSSDNIRETFRQKLENVNAIHDKKYYEKLPLTTNNSFIDFGGLFSIFEVQKQSIVNDYEDLLDLKGATINLEDMKKHSFQPISSVETDPSQQSILHSLESTRNILIQGPPGTGKSQTLTAVLINALENHKKVLVVCEKRTALEVLHNSLNEKELGYQCVLIKDIVKNRRTVVNSVRERIDNSSYRSNGYSYSKDSLQNLVDKAGKLINTINTKHKKLDEKLLGDKDWSHIVGSFLSESKENDETVDLKLIKSHFKYNQKELNNTIDIIKKGQILYDAFKPYLHLSFLNPQKFTGDNPYVIENKLKADFLSYQNELDKIESLIQIYQKEYYKIRNNQLLSQNTEITESITAITKIVEEHKDDNDFYNEKRTKGYYFRFLSIFSKEKKNTIIDQNEAFYLFEGLSHIISNCNDINYTQVDGLLKDKVKSIGTLKENIENVKSNFSNQIKKEFESLNLNDELPGELNTKAVKSLSEKCNGLLTRVNADSWTPKTVNESSIKSILKKITHILKQKEKYFSHEDDIFIIEYNWFSFYNKLSKKNTILIDQLMDKKDWSRVFLIYYFNTILTISANNNLPTNNRDHTDLNKNLIGLEREQIKYIKNYWFSKQISATRKFFMRNPDLSVENLYNKRSSRKFKRLSLRQIVKFDQELFTTFFPIVLTTPDVSSNLFKGKDKYFDIVMFDEASQLKLEDNLPAMLKGKQIIVAGDEHQMPPSNYFSKIFDGTIDDENDIEEEEVTINKENTLLSCESLLDFATELNFDKKHLDFHYRSRHPYLIDFSNYAFYNRRLMPLPNTFDYIPFKYIQVNGAYLDHTNEAEAEAVLAIIENNINRLPNGEYPSVGIATFNIAQRNLIKSKIIERQKFDRYVSFNEKILELEENGLFIKNLENIQGDERDVIILSTTYGINKDGKFAQRFGPINHQKGYKLLNVIITRAKYKVYVCTSIPEQVFLNYREYLTIEGSNNKRAVFYAYLAYSKAVSDGNNEQRLAILDSLSENSATKSSYDYLVEDLESPFEEEVYNALLDHFEADKIIPQFKFAGFRIDMVYDSKIKGIPRIAIECDGASYHSSKEAYLYDSHRQKILEENGFVFHRIWSTNWWRNPERETKKLVSFIKKNEDTSFIDFTEKADLSTAFTDDVKLINKGIYKDAFIDKEVVRNNTEVVDSQEQIKFKLKEQKIDKNVINENSKIVLKYINDEKELTLQLVKDAEAKQAGANGIQKISTKSPLAAWILGKKVGDLVKLGKLDNYVEIVRIEN